MVTVGIDEVGRGCWAGPVVAAAVALDRPLPGLKDSKLLTKLQREKLALKIETEALSIGIGWVAAEVIDEVGIGNAIKLASEQALQQITLQYDSVIVDGNVNYIKNNPKSQAIIKADAKVPAVSAASIVAKVARDNFMVEQSKAFAHYGFETHVGYGTAAHIAALERLGVCRLHRKSYKPIKKLLNLSEATLQ